jgi:hypothetical protein
MLLDAIVRGHLASGFVASLGSFALLQLVLDSWSFEWQQGRQPSY